jgi:pilus assembly protein CpaB
VLITYHPAAPATPPALGAPAGGTDLITSTVLQNVRVLAAGQKLEADPDGKATNASVVTLLVSPQDAEKLTLASSLGKILFVLRNSSDRKEVADLTPQVSLSGGAPPQIAKPAALAPAKHAPPPVPRYTVQTIAGDKLTEATFEGKAK